MMTSNEELARELRARLEAQERRQAELLTELRRLRGEEPPRSGSEQMNDALRRARARGAPVTGPVAEPAADPTAASNPNTAMNSAIRRAAGRGLGEETP